MGEESEESEVREVHEVHETRRRGRPKKRVCRANGEGTLEKRGNYFLARWTVNGKHYARSTKCTDRAEAEKKLREFVKPYQAGSELEVLENLAAKMRSLEGSREVLRDEPVEVADLIEVWQKDVNTEKVTDSTLANYEGMLDNVVKRLSSEKKFVYELKKEDADECLVKLKEDCCAVRYNQCLFLMKKLVDVAMQHDNNIKSNVFAGYKKLKPEASERRALTSEELSMLNEVLEKRGDEELVVLFALGLYAGLRKSDCATLKWSEVDFMRRMIKRVPKKTKKNGRAAVVPMHESLMKLLYSMKKDSEHVLPRMNEMYEKKTLSRLLNDVFSEAGIKTFYKTEEGKMKLVASFHSLRHTFTSKCMNAGVPIAVIQTMLAHSSSSMSMKYCHVSESDLKLPDFDESSVKISVSKEVLKLAESLAKKNESLSDVLVRVLSEEVKRSALLVAQAV